MPSTGKCKTSVKKYKSSTKNMQVIDQTHASHLPMKDDFKIRNIAEYICMYKYIQINSMRIITNFMIKSPK